MTDIQKYQPQESALSEQIRYAQAVSDGDLLPQAYRGKPANVLLAVGLGAPMGLTPTEALYRIDVIQGKPTASAELIASNVRKAGHKLRVLPSEASCTAQIIRADDPDFTFEVSRDMAWAQKMGLTTKDNYKKQPGTMLQWRAITAVARLACPEALYGVSYTADELEDLGERRALAAPTASAVAALTSAAAASEAAKKPEPTPTPAPAQDWYGLADAADGDVATLQSLYADAENNGADPDTLTYIRNSAKETA